MIARTRALVVTLLVALVSAGPAGAHPGAVATEHQLAADAGAAALAAGGSAVDAAVAAAAAVCVVHPSSCGLGGGGFALVHDAAGRDVALDYREVAPAEARPERYRTDGKPDPAKNRTGGLAIGVPGEPAGLVALHRRFGRVPLATVLAPAVRLARDGFALGDAPHLRREIERNRTLLAADPGLRARFLATDGGLPGPDFRVVQPELARSLALLGDEGDASFYRGAIAADIVRTVAGRGGVLSAADLAGYRPVWRKPLTGTFRGRRIVTFPPPGSGGVVLEVLGLLGHDDLAALGAGSATSLQLLAGALAQGFADRTRWLGDPAFTEVPIATLLAPPRLARLRAELSPLRLPPAAGAAADAGTGHVSAVDAAGNACAITTTINTGFGAGVLAPESGLVLNNELDDFVLEPGLPNVYGLGGSEANVIRPGKRPASSMSPTIVLAGRRPELVVGGSGGPFIVSGTLQVLLGVTAFGMDLRHAVDAPRIHHQGSSAVLLLEPTVDGDARRALERVGHRIREFPGIGAVAAVGLDENGRPVAAGDRRKDGGAAVVP